MVLNLNESVDMAPTHLMAVFMELKDAIFRYAALATELSFNAAVALSHSKNQFITSESRIVDAIGRVPSPFDDTTKLTAACALIDRVQDATGNFSEGIAKRFQEMKLSVMPNEVEIIAELAGLTRKEANIIDFDASAERVRELIHKIQAASDYLEENINPQEIRFRCTTDKLAFSVERKLRSLADGIFKLLPDSVKL